MQLKEKIDQEVSIVGTISDIMWQHMIAYEPGYPEILYFDPKNGDNQMVLYAKAQIKNIPNKYVKVFGIVKEIKSSGEKGQKIEDGDYREYHLIVSRYEYVD
ncbi:hypothetical protein DSAG12_01020 [Promethearchaeum syntrophicum]|uniref:OB-fold nucleic acid binding domain protein n=1 Tax=Promethearchaeum syntrophicum TaxID=2594042 RepID=A0A5B9D9D3_9ARCH|nr:hypothetical protein [Candidatus Prometheoarchaeum syntrophicum]QEE15196.1 hypothetical protein DSAG12_01020 [Candidatus Prometheoarchaeum syntrophicum]